MSNGELVDFYNPPLDWVSSEYASLSVPSVDVFSPFYNPDTNQIEVPDYSQALSGLGKITSHTNSLSEVLGKTIDVAGKTVRDIYALRLAQDFRNVPQTQNEQGKVIYYGYPNRQTGLQTGYQIMPQSPLKAGLGEIPSSYLIIGLIVLGVILIAR
jgi:hypothetical protein